MIAEFIIITRHKYTELRGALPSPNVSARLKGLPDTSPPHGLQDKEQATWN